MVETFFTRSCTLNRLRQGPLAGHIDMLAEWLEAHGFSRVHSRIQIRLVGHFNRWLDQKGLSAKQIDETLIEHYWRFFQRRKRVRWFDVGALVRLLDLLRQEGVTPQRRIEAVPTPREALLESYRCYRARSAVLPREQSALQFPSLIVSGAQISAAPLRLRGPECQRHHHVHSKAGGRTRFRASQTYGHGAPRVFPLSSAPRAVRDRSRRLCASRPILLALHSSETCRLAALRRSYQLLIEALQPAVAITRC